MCTNRALTDLYAFSARFIQLLNRKLAYVCIADYYKSEQNVLFCLTLTSNPQLSSSASFLRLNVLSSLN